MKGNCSKLERWNGTTWDLIAKRVSIQGPELTRETVEEDLTLDCSGSGGAASKKKSPGTKEHGDLEIEVIYNFAKPREAEVGPPIVTEIANADKHHFFLEDFESETATFWRIRHADEHETGILVHGTVKTLGAPEYKPNESVKRSITIEPTGEFYHEGNEIEDFELPDSPEAPVEHWGS
jgi:hypothetical protein